MAIRFDNGFKEFYMPDGESVLKDYSPNEEITIITVPIKEFAYKKDSGYGVYQCEEVIDDTSKVPGTFIITGTFVAQIDIGQTYEVVGKIKEHKGENQISVSQIKKVLPANKRGIINFFKSFSGVGVYPELIYEKFGDKSLQILKDEPMKIVDAFPALWEEKVMDWRKQLEDVRDDYYIMTRLLAYGLKPTQIKGLFDKFGGAILQKIEQNPYFLAAEVRNYSFKKCDEIAQMMGFSPADPMRITEGIFYTISNAKYAGHTYLPYDVLIEQSKDNLALKIGINDARKLLKSMGTSENAIYKYGNMSFKVSKEELSMSIKNHREAKTKEEKEDMKICVFEPSDEILKTQIEMLIASKRIHIEDKKVFDFDSYNKESKIAWDIARINENFKPIESNIKDYLDKYCEKMKIVLEEKQKEAILDICSGKGGVFVLNGSAGCGKTFCLGIAIEMLKKLYKKQTGYFSSFTVAPTGKAAQVAAEATGMEASTIHKLLKYSPDSGYFYTASNQLYFDLLIIDESSMLDVDLAAALLDATDVETKVVFVGDTKQLPSVGAGNVLKDIINSGTISVTTLNVVKRQGKNSGIIKNANRIIDGEMPKTEKETKDAYVFLSDSQTSCLNKTIEVIKRRLKMGVDIEDIQVLCPMKRGTVGTNYMNYALQKEFNHDIDGLEFLNRSVYMPDGTIIDLMFRKGDKVIHTKNNYNAKWYGIHNKRLVELEETGVANGECGKIIKLMEHEDEYKNIIRTIFVKYQDKIIRYDDDFSELDLAYALTIHKSQGSQWDSVIIPIMSNSYVMLDREILYTGYTRAQKMSFLITEKSALQTAVKRIRSTERYTDLKEMLQASVK